MADIQATIDYAQRVGFRLERKNQKTYLLHVTDQTTITCNGIDEAHCMITIYNMPDQRFKVLAEEMLRTQLGTIELARIVSQSRAFDHRETPLQQAALNTG